MPIVDRELPWTNVGDIGGRVRYGGIGTQRNSPE